MARLGFVLALVLAAALAAPAMGQTRIVAVVNGEAITSYEVAQRARLLRLTGQKGDLQGRALEELINERIQKSAVEQAKIPVSEGDIDGAIANIARSANISPAQLEAAFSQAGVSMDTLRDRIAAQIGFSRLVRARFQASSQITEQDLVAALRADEDKPDAIEAARYDLHQVTIALPDNPSRQRLDAANARAADLRRRFASCEDGLKMAKDTLNVVVRPFGQRMDVEFPPPVREALANTEVGKLTEPIDQPRGLVMFAVCDKTMVTSTNAAMKALEPEMAEERGEAFGKQYLRQLKRDAVIERR